MIFLLETVRLGLSNLRLHILRSVLTALGIILGVCAVITMVSIGEGSKQAALEQIEQLGARNIIVRSIRPPEDIQAQSMGGGRRGGFQVKYGLTRADLEAIREQFRDATAIAPLKEVGMQVLRGPYRKTSQAFGVTPDLLRVAKLTVARGRYITREDMEQSSPVAVIGHELARTLFRYEDALGKTLRIDAQVFTVVGILAPVGLSGGSGAALVGRDLNHDVHIPETTARARFGDLIVRRSQGQFSAAQVQVSEVYIESPSRERVMLDGDRLERIIKVRHPKMDDVQIVVPYELLESAKRAALTWQVVLGFIAGISLLVGGIGIMNIMLASVTERTREIGIRRALGATRKHIVWQFLVETGVLSMLGGIVGVGLGIGCSLLFGWGAPIVAERLGVDMDISARITSWSVFLSFGVAMCTGLVFGVYPAVVASRQDPIVALRHD